MNETDLTQFGQPLYAVSMQENKDVGNEVLASVEDTLKRLDDSNPLKEKAKATLEKLKKDGKEGKKMSLMDLIKEWFKWLFIREKDEKNADASKGEDFAEQELHKRMRNAIEQKANAAGMSTDAHAKKATLEQLPNKNITFLSEADLAKPGQMDALTASWNKFLNDSDNKIPEADKQHYKIAELVEMGAKPPITRKDIANATAEEKKKLEATAYANGKITDNKMRIQAAQQLLDITMDEYQKDALIDAHNVGSVDGKKQAGKYGKGEAGIGNYSNRQLAQKMKILQDAWFDEVQARKLLWSGLAGDGNDKPLPPPPPGHEDKTQTRNIELAKSEWAREIAAHPDMTDEQIQEAEMLANLGVLPTSLNKTREVGNTKFRARRDFETLGDLEENQKEKKVGNIYNLCDEIMRYSDPKWDWNGSHPLLRRATDKDGNPIMRMRESTKIVRIPVRKPQFEEDGVTPALDDEGNQIYVNSEEHREVPDNKEIPVYEVDQANFISWFRDRLVFFHNDSPDEVFSLFQKVRLQREYRDISIGEMLENQERYFRDDTGNEQYKELANQIRRELFTFGNSRNAHIEYVLVMGEETKVPEALHKHFYANNFTKEAWNKSFFHWIFTMPKKFGSNADVLKTPQEWDKESRKPRPQPTLDAEIGAAVNAVYLAYYHISDYEKLVSILGEKADILDPKKIRRKAIELAFKDDRYLHRLKQERIPDETDPTGQKTKPKYTEESIAEMKGEELDALIKNVSPAEIGEYVDQKDYADLDYIDEDTGEHKGLINFINVFNKNAKQTHQISVIRELMRDSIQHQFGVKNESINPKTGKPIYEKGWELLDPVEATYAENWAFTMTRWTGAGARNDLRAQAYDAWTKLQLTRPYRKKQARDTRGGGIGNPYSVFGLKSIARDLMTGTRTEAEKKRIDRGRGKDDYVSYKNPLEVLEEFHEKRKEGGLGINPDELQNVAKQLVFPENTMRSFVIDHVNRGMTVFQQVMSGQEINIDKFTSFDAWNGGIKFDRAQFIETVQEKLIKPLRYLYSTWDQINLSSEVRWYNDQADRYETVPIAYAILGKQLLNIPAFLDDNGEIDYEKVNQKKDQFFKQVALFRLATDMWAHRDFYSTDPRYDMSYYLHIIEAIERIPGDIKGSEEDMQVGALVGNFFNHDDIHFLRKLSDTEDGTLYRDQIKRDFYKSIGPGFGEMLKLFFQGVSAKS